MAATTAETVAGRPTDVRTSRRTPPCANSRSSPRRPPAVDGSRREHDQGERPDLPGGGEREHGGALTQNGPRRRGPRRPASASTHARCPDRRVRGHAPGTGYGPQVLAPGDHVSGWSAMDRWHGDVLDAVELGAASTASSAPTTRRLGCPGLGLSAVGHQEDETADDDCE